MSISGFYSRLGLDQLSEWAEITWKSSLNDVTTPSNIRNNQRQIIKICKIYCISYTL